MKIPSRISGPHRSRPVCVAAYRGYNEVGGDRWCVGDFEQWQSIRDTTSGRRDGTSTTASGRPVAPDFTLELNDGGTYTLSEGEKPVYLVFWAEW